MPIVIGAVAPHGFPIIPDISDDADGGLATRAAMQEMSRRFAEAKPDVVFITGPHGVRVNGFVSVADTSEGAGTLHYNGRTVEMSVLVDTQFTESVVETARARGVPVAEVGYGGSARQGSVLPLDWGVMTPLWFAGHDRNMTGYGYELASFLNGQPERSGPSVVIANPSQRLPREVNVEFGRAVAEAANADDRRIAFIASCDWAHRHIESGPGGYHPDAKRMDALVVEDQGQRPSAPDRPLRRIHPQRRHRRPLAALDAGRRDGYHADGRRFSLIRGSDLLRDGRRDVSSYVTRVQRTRKVAARHGDRCGGATATE
jgi:aromatic ring-opening dioxygenase LigB subunit